MLLSAAPYARYFPLALTPYQSSVVDIDIILPLYLISKQVIPLIPIFRICFGGNCQASVFHLHIKPCFGARRFDRLPGESAFCTVKTMLGFDGWNLLREGPVSTQGDPQNLDIHRIALNELVDASRPGKAGLSTDWTSSKSARAIEGAVDFFFLLRVSRLGEVEGDCDEGVLYIRILLVVATASCIM